jgi:tetratricopeptide (TPR) repeat protein
VSKKHHHDRRPAPLSPAELKARVERARREGRFQQALELVKQLYKEQPTEAHRQLLKDTYLDRARQLRTGGQTRDAAIVLEASARVDETNPAWLGQLAGEIARCGDVVRALAVLERIAEADRPADLLGHLGDAAVAQDGQGRDKLPAALRADVERIESAFRQVEAGQDEAARETLAGIGLRSPLLEWKLLLRGLQAYHARDDERALENWQRLNPERLPARLAAPFRYHIDSHFRAAQPPPTQKALQGQFDRLQGSALLPQMRNLRSALANPESLAQAFRLAEGLVPALRAEAPHLLPRLASCMYWACLETGPDDVLRYQRVFGKPPDDPNFSRLHALAYDKAPNRPEAHRHWQQYEKEMAGLQGVWPAEQVTRARALVWKHLGDNAASIPSPRQRARLPRFLRDLPDELRPLKPSADRCYEKALELAPDLLEAHEALLHFYRNEEDEAQTEKAARRLLEHFPDHVETLGELADLRLKHKAPDESLALLQRALKNNPLDRRLRERVSTAHMHSARTHAEAGRFAEARRHYQSALTFVSPGHQGSILCRWAACEIKAGDTARADELLAQAQGQEVPLLVTYIMLTESIRLKLPPAVKRRYDREFNAGMAAPPTGAAAAALAGFTLSLERMGLEYRGQKTHAKKVLTYVDGAITASFTEEQLVSLCEALLALGRSKRTLATFLRLGQRRFPKNPFFPYLEALTYLHPDDEFMPGYQVQPLLQRAQELARALPRDERLDQLLEDIEHRLRALAVFSPFAGGGFGGSFGGSIFDRLFEVFGGPEDDDDEDEDFDDWDDEPPRRGRPRRR